MLNKLKHLLGFIVVKPVADLPLDREKIYWVTQSPFLVTKVPPQLEKLYRLLEESMRNDNEPRVRLTQAQLLRYGWKIPKTHTEAQNVVDLLNTRERS